MICSSKFQMFKMFKYLELYYPGQNVNDKTMGYGSPLLFQLVADYNEPLKWSTTPILFNNHILNNGLQWILIYWYRTCTKYLFSMNYNVANLKNWGFRLWLYLLISKWFIYVYDVYNDNFIFEDQFQSVKHIKCHGVA